MALINEDWGSFAIDGTCFADKTKGLDSTLGPFGVIEQFSIT